MWRRQKWCGAILALSPTNNCFPSFNWSVEAGRYCFSCSSSLLAGVCLSNDSICANSRIIPFQFQNFEAGFTENRVGPRSQKSYDKSRPSCHLFHISSPFRPFQIQPISRRPSILAKRINSSYLLCRWALLALFFFIVSFFSFFIIHSRFSTTELGD